MTHVSTPAASIVIGFRDWGLDRLVTAVRSHFVNARLCGIQIEVIVSDYGSKNADEIVCGLEPLGAMVVRTEASGPWNRSAALNVGVRAASAPCIVTTDADIVFAPTTLSSICERVTVCPHALYLVQCRDLPKGFTGRQIRELLEANWESGVRIVHENSAICPRWGEGGCAAFSSEVFEAVNGYDERMEVWGGEDNDFSSRARRAGYPARWLSRSGVAIYHIWHESTHDGALKSKDGLAAVQRNRRIMKQDSTVLRNLSWGMVTPGCPPLISIVIPTYQRARMLRDAIASCLAQTFQSFEIIVVENGNSDEAEPVVRECGDARIRYVHCPKKGAAAARNVGLIHAIGRYVVVHDDDDVMVSTRLHDHLAALKVGMHGTYTGWIDFDQETFEVTAMHSGMEFSFEALLIAGRVLTHSGAMLDRHVFSMFRYDEGLVAGVDYGFMLRLGYYGLRLGHTGTFGSLKRLHDSTVTVLSADAQQTAARNMRDAISRESGSRLHSECRRRGKAALTLTCHNGDAALAEMAEVRSHALAGHFDEILEAKNFGGGTLESLRDCADRLDDWILRRVSHCRSLPIRVSGFSRPAMMSLRLRGISLAAAIGCPAPTWMAQDTTAATRHAQRPQEVDGP
jgi:glycosyltransferase involved in cell wall biosynthesis